MSEQITLDGLIAYLNELTEIDRFAVAALITTRTLCNEAMMEHPSLQVSRTDTDKGYALYTSVLALLNGMFGIREDGRGVITAFFDAENRLIGFKRTSEFFGGISGGGWSVGLGVTDGLTVDG